MALQFILGASGVGKTKYLYDTVTKQAAEQKDKNFYFIVPEQITLQTQMALVQNSPVKGICNIDVLSMVRLAHKVFQELGQEQRKILKDIGKSMVVKRALGTCRGELALFGANAGQNGFVEETKSLLSELLQYGITEDVVREWLTEHKEEELLCKKLQDILVILTEFHKLLGDKYMTSEELYDVLAGCMDRSGLFANCEVILEGFTGFTPSQYGLLKKLMQTVEKVSVSLIYEDGAELFSMSRQTMEQLKRLAAEAGCEVLPDLMVGTTDYRHDQSGALHHMWGNLFRYPVKLHRLAEGQKELQVYAGADATAECRYAVTKIQELLQTEGYRYRDIAVMVSDIRLYGECMERELQRAGIPCFLDYKKNMSENAFAEYLKIVLQLAESGFRTENVISYMKNSLSGWDKNQVWKFENYCLALGIKSYHFAKEWKRSYRTRSEVSVEEMEELRRLLVEELQPLMDCFSKEETTVTEYSKALFYFLKDRQMEWRLKEREELFTQQGDLLRAREYAQVYRVVLELLDQLVELLGDEVLTPKEYRELLETGLREAKVGLIPAGSEQIVIGDMERTRFGEIRAMFFLGINEGKVPAQSGGKGILSDKDKEALSGNGVELSPDPVEKMSRGQFYLYMNLTKPKERLYCTYSCLNEEGKAVRRSYFIGKLEGLFENLEIHTAYETRSEELVQNDGGREAFLNGLRQFAEGEAEEVFSELYRFHATRMEEERLEQLLRLSLGYKEKEVLDGKTALALYGPVIGGSVTRLESYARCAFAHFLKYGIELEERAEYELKSADLGNLYHDGLRRFGEAVKAQGKKWHQLSEEERDRLAEQSAKEAVEAYTTDVFVSSAKNRYLLKQMVRVLKRTIGVTTMQLAESEFSPDAFEQKFSHTDRNLNLYGIIDRVDVAETPKGEYVKIVDYKSGDRDFSLEQMYYGLSVQLAVYLAAVLREKGSNAVPAAMFYYHVDDPIVNKTVNPQEELWKKLRAKGLVNEKREIIRKLDLTFSDAAGGLAPSVKSVRIPVETDKEGTPAKRSKLADSTQFADITEFVYRKLQEETGEILDGNAEIAPYKLKKKTGCDYCEYASVCGFDKKSGSEFRGLEPLDDTEVFRRIRREEEAMDGGN